MINDLEKENEMLIKSISDMTVASYRFKRVFERVLQKLEVGEQTRYQGQLAWFNKKIDETLLSSGLNLINLEGQKYEIGMAATALNIGDFGKNDILIVAQMIEPIIMFKSCIVKTGTIILGREEI